MARSNPGGRMEGDGAASIHFRFAPVLHLSFVISYRSPQSSQMQKGPKFALGADGRPPPGWTHPLLHFGGLRQGRRRLGPLGIPREVGGKGRKRCAGETTLSADGSTYRIAGHAPKVRLGHQFLFVALKQHADSGSCVSSLPVQISTHKSPTPISREQGK